METNYDDLMLVELRTLLRSMPSAALQNDDPMPAPSVSVNTRPRPPKLTRPPPPPPESSLTPYELE